MTSTDESFISGQPPSCDRNRIEAETPGRGRSFAGILTRVERPVRRAVELALFESKTSFEAFGIVPELQVIDIDATKPLDEQLKSNSQQGLNNIGPAKTRVH